MCCKLKSVIKFFSAWIGLFTQFFDFVTDFYLMETYFTIRNDGDRDFFWGFFVLSFIILTTLYNIYDIISDHAGHPAEEGCWRWTLIIASIFQLRGFVTGLRYCGQDPQKMVTELEWSKNVEVVLESLPQTLLTSYVIISTMPVSCSGDLSDLVENQSIRSDRSIFLISLTFSFLSATFSTTDGGVQQRIWGFLWSLFDIFGRVVSLALLAVAKKGYAVMAIFQICIVRILWKFCTEPGSKMHIILQAPSHTFIDLEEFQTEVEKRRNACVPAFLHIIAIFESAYMISLAYSANDTWGFDHTCEQLESLDDGEEFLDVDSVCGSFPAGGSDCFRLVRNYDDFLAFVVAVVIAHVVKILVAVPFAKAVTVDFEEDEEEKIAETELNEV